MADKLLRDEIWTSDRFLDLQTDTQRLAFIRLLSETDDFGNLEGGIRRIYRMLTTVMHVKCPEEAAKILEALVDVDLIRLYEVNDTDRDGKDLPNATRQLIHIPRLHSHRQYMVRKVPASPWCDKDVVLGKTQRVIKQGLAKNVVATLQQRTSNVTGISQVGSKNVREGVGVGVGEGEKLSAATTGGTRAGQIVAKLRHQGVAITGAHPGLLALIASEVTDVQIQEGVDRCRLQKPAPTQIPAAYWVKVMEDVMNPPEPVQRDAKPKADAWWASNEGIDRRGRELKMTARGGESYPDFKQRLFERERELKAKGELA